MAAVRAGLRGGDSMGTASGGVATAAGLGFQCLVAVESLLDWLASDIGEFVFTTEDPHDDVIDFSVSVGDRLHTATQAKASVDGPEGKLLSPSDIVDAAARLVQFPAELYLIRTNRKVSPEAESLLEILAGITRDCDPAEVAIRLRHGLRRSTALQVSKLEPEQFLRLGQVRVESVHESIEALAVRLVDRIRDVRTRNSRGGGHDTSRVLLRYLVAEILHRSGRRAGRTLSRTEAAQIVGMSDRTLAHSLGTYDWGNPIGPFPSISTLRRPEILDEALRLLDGPPQNRMVRTIAFLGLSGIGKSAMAANFAELTSTRYDRMMWIDASDEPAIRNQVASVLGPDAAEQSSSEVADRFRECFIKYPGSWLLIFDNAATATDLLSWIPARGHVDVIVTSSNSTAWNQWPRIDLPAMAEQEALELVKLRMQISQLTKLELIHAQRLTATLDNWPLAIELACAFLIQSGRGLHFTDRYLGRLAARIVDDQALVPPEYHSHPTLLQAILVALDTVDAEDQKCQSGLGATRMLHILAYLPARAAPLEIAGRIGIYLQHNHAGGVSDKWLDDSNVELAIDDAVRRLATASLVQRVKGLEPAGSLTRTNAIVLDIVRQLHDDSDRIDVLEMLQITVGEHLRHVLDDQHFARAQELVPSALTIVRHALHYEALNTHGVTTTGNLAAYMLTLGDFTGAYAMFTRELEMLDSAGIKADMLRTKIHAGILQAQVHLEADTTALAHTFESALLAAEGAIDRHEPAAESLALAMSQLLEVVLVLQQSTTFTDKACLNAWQNRALQIAPGAAHGKELRDAHMSLSRLDNDDEQTLHYFESALALPQEGPRQFVDLQFSRAEALAYLGRYPAACEAFKEAVNYARELALGLAPGWTLLLNAWFAAASRLLGAHQCEASTYRFCVVLDGLIGQDQPSNQHEISRLALCRAMTSAMADPIVIAESRIAAINDDFAKPSHLMRETSGHAMAAKACHDILTLRRQLRGAQLVTMSGWGLDSRLPLNRYVLSLPAEHSGTLPSKFPQHPAIGYWLTHAAGVGLAIRDPVNLVVWAPTFETGWIFAKGSVPSKAATRLRYRIMAHPTDSFMETAAVTTEDAMPVMTTEQLDAASQVMILGRTNFDVMKS